MTEVPRAAGVTREALYKALSEEGDPRLTTVLSVARLGRDIVRASTRDLALGDPLLIDQPSTRHRDFARLRGEAVSVFRTVRQSGWAPGRMAGIDPLRTYIA